MTLVRWSAGMCYKRIRNLVVIRNCVVLEVWKIPCRMWSVRLEWSQYHHAVLEFGLDWICLTTTHILQDILALLLCWSCLWHLSNMSWHGRCYSFLLSLLQALTGLQPLPVSWLVGSTLLGAVNLSGPIVVPGNLGVILHLLMWCPGDIHVHGCNLFWKSHWCCRGQRHAQQRLPWSRGHCGSKGHRHISTIFTPSCWLKATCQSPLFANAPFHCWRCGLKCLSGSVQQ